MTTLLDLTANRIQMRNPDGTLKFDTDKRMLRILDYYSGTIAIPAVAVSTWGATSTVIDSNVNPDAEFVIGSLRVRNCAEPFSIGAQNEKWHTFAGSYMHTARMGPKIGGSTRIILGTLRVISIMIDNGELILKQLGATQQFELYQMYPFDFDYRIWTVTFK